ncbi:DEAD/DEAH box helicase family protein [Sphingobacterium faecium]
MYYSINFPQSRTYRSGTDHEPFQFYLECLSNCTQFDLLLGYFSSAAISVLSLGFAKFIHNGGCIRIIANQILSEKDKNAILLAQESNIESPFDLTDINALKVNLDEYGKHFFNCLAYLIYIKRIEIKVVKPKKKGITHYKSGIFYDGLNKISFQASCNFTAYGLLENAESLHCFLSKDSSTSVFKIQEDEEYFNNIYNEKADYLEYLSADSIETAIQTEFGGMDIEELLINEKELIEKKRNTFAGNTRLLKLINELEIEIDKIANEPRFPFATGALDYQIQAYQNWVKNGYSGLFSMATGTGKTITSLNCALNLYSVSKTYHILILVPSIALLNQWENEVLQFNFKNILKVGGGNKWESEFSDYCSNFKYDIKPNLCIIAVNDSFASPKFQKYYNQIEKEFLLIADEAHNLGSDSLKKILIKINPEKRIGLSATPKRIYDPAGTEFLNSFFKDEEPYCYNFPMSKALAERRLTQYFYYPRVVQLDADEQEEYNKISKDLLKYFDFEAGKFKQLQIVETLLLKRKRIIHKAKAKLSEFINILKELKSNNKLKYIFTYVPEGIDKDDVNENRIINQYIKAAYKFDNSLKLASYTATDENHKDILDSFEEGVIDIVFAMKMLDEGVDIPRTEIGIFASSTGNPRQYIQRRGRLLRNHKDKAFSTVYDLIVIPHKNNEDPSLYNIERNLLRSEMNRVAYFASLSLNQNDTKKELQGICNSYDLDIDVLIQELE